MTRKEQLLQEALQTKQTLIRFLRHPLTEMKLVPKWPWRQLIFLEATVAALTGILAAIIDRKMALSIVAGAIISPIFIFVTLSIATIFFYYCFQIFANRTVSIRHLFTVVLFANIPAMFLRTLEGQVPPVTLVGMAFTALLLMVGFVENFKMDRKLVIRMIGTLYTILFVLWIYNQISSYRMEKSWNHDRVEAPEVELGK